MDLTLALIDQTGRVMFPKTIVKRTRSIWYGGCKLRRRADYHGRWVYIVQFVTELLAIIEYGDGDQYIVEVDDEKFILKETKN